VHARLSGSNLSAECRLCFEPMRIKHQVRLGCACGEVDSVWGCVLHLECARRWLDE